MSRSPEDNPYWSDAYARAQRARPFLRWAGGKGRFCHAYGHLLPPSFDGRYIEPFLGGGAVFFHMWRTQGRPFEARLGDANRHLIRAYSDVRDRPHEVHERLVGLQAGYAAATDKSAYYYEIRDDHNARHPRPDTATFIFLNRTCWNGLWRVNERGRFNVPYGAPKSEVVIPDLDDLLDTSAALQGALIRATSWENTVALAEPGDFVFLDPPYYSEVVAGSSSNKYQRGDFGLQSHERLAMALARLADRGVDFVLTNSAETAMVSLYRDHGLETRLIEMPRSISSKGDERGRVPELVVTSGGERQQEPGRASVLLDLEAHRLKARARARGSDGVGGARAAGETGAVDERDAEDAAEE